jgi:periplasmic divalent cation tolerance protein
MQEIKTTTDSKEHALLLSKIIIKNKFAACSQIIGPITSTYMWNNQLQEETEWKILFKTTAQHVDIVIKTIKENHHYEIPEITSNPIDYISPDYKNWVLTTLKT